MDDEIYAVDAIVRRRLNNLSYLQRIHLGEAQWMNCILLTKEEVHSYYMTETATQDRWKRWICLGMSISSLLETTDLKHLLIQFIRLFEEFFFFFPEEKVDSSKEALLNETLQYGNAFDVLVFCPMPFSQVDPVSVLMTLLDVLNLFYRKLQDHLTFQEDETVTINRLDSFIKELIIEPIVQDINQLSMSIISNSMSDLLGIASTS
eukprot:TRINITY_DN6228_c0_g1_i1.p1 TRINITY_DN6228_c0_g1~~TRINITY_DN6228_c0_g1_i1.p1  ORF type:complete len:206 (+),score=42.13 TRINITY_DN6228_c0_g1_i1:3-620(+)